MCLCLYLYCLRKSQEDSTHHLNNKSYLDVNVHFIEIPKKEEKMNSK